MTIELGIVVVYMVSEGGEGLIDLHLDRITRHTSVPYSIHGSVNRLAADGHRSLEHRARVKLHELLPTRLRGADEHSHYLDQLVRLAIEDGATHVAILHVDSFPVHDGWVEALVGKLSDSVAFVTIEGIDTACLLFHRDFYLAHRPPFLLSTERQRSVEYTTFHRTAHLNLHHSGTGFGFEAHQQGLDWYSMRVSSRDHASGAAIYDDVLFHLKGAMSLSAQLQTEMGVSESSPRWTPWLVERLGMSRLEGVLRAARALAPQRVREGLRSRFGPAFGSLVDEPRLRWHTKARDRLLADPDAFIEHLRGHL